MCHSRLTRSKREGYSLEAIILAGGLGTRLRSVCKDIPKPMAKVSGKPFLEHLLEYWVGQGVKRFILSVGYLHEQIQGYFGSSFMGASISYSVEKTPLKTGGALLLSIEQLKNPSDPFLLLNGDTFFPLELEEFSVQGPVTLSLVDIEQNTRYGGVLVGPNQVVLSMNAKESNKVNAGCYLIHQEVLSCFSKNIPLSLEQDVFPSLIQQGLCFGTTFQRPFLDIGIPEDYFRAESFLNTCC